MTTITNTLPDERVKKRPNTLSRFSFVKHQQKNAVRVLSARLTKDGMDAWFGKKRLLPGQNWELEIRRTVREVEVVVFCLSKRFD